MILLSVLLITLGWSAIRRRKLKLRKGWSMISKSYAPPFYQGVLRVFQSRKLTA
ncbi:MAG: hypothetical protein HF978_16920 [Desulfobacteraceae bacterium]|nr:hypothetical protein [Desulfobacteraceae bacterium]MBC2757227.1 hypothetical protein [Desulfobacteraceae bacterium]